MLDQWVDYRKGVKTCFILVDDEGTCFTTKESVDFGVRKRRGEKRLDFKSLVGTNVLYTGWGGYTLIQCIVKRKHTKLNEVVFDSKR